MSLPHPLRGILPNPRRKPPQLAPLRAISPRESKLPSLSNPFLIAPPQSRPAVFTARLRPSSLPSQLRPHRSQPSLSPHGPAHDIPSLRPIPSQPLPSPQGPGTARLSHPVVYRAPPS